MGRNLVCTRLIAGVLLVCCSAAMESPPLHAATISAFDIAADEAELRSAATTLLADAKTRSQSKVKNSLTNENTSAARSHATFVEAALRAPTKNRCETLGPDPAYVQEMLIDRNSIGRAQGTAYERRVAFVVGNGAYTTGKLDNPPRDAESMARMLSALGFTVYRGINLQKLALEDCLSSYYADLAGREKADVALFYYAGHGLQLTSDDGKRNYMLATDARIDRDGAARGFKQIDAVLAEMRAHSHQSVFLYDACRSNPFGEAVIRSVDGVAVHRAPDVDGAAAINVEQTAVASAAGIFIAYATSPDKTADDAWADQTSDNGRSIHSPFTQALLDHLATPGVIIEEALADAYYEVGELTGHRQTPWTNSSLQKRLMLNGAVRAGDVQIRSSELAAQSMAARVTGQKEAAIKAALKGMPRIWSEGDSALAFASARAELFRAYHARFTTLAGHKKMLSGAAFSPDGRKVVTASWDKTAKVWDSITGQLIMTLEHGGWVMSARFSPHGKRIITVASDKFVRIWDASQGRLLHSFSNPGGLVKSARFSPNGEYILAAYEDGTARVLDAESGKEAHILKDPRGGAIKGAVYSHDGKRIAVLIKDKDPDVKFLTTSVRILKAEDGSELTSVKGAFTDVNFSPDGSQFVTASLNQIATVWNVTTGEEVFSLSGHDGTVTSAAYSADGRRIITASQDKTARIWDAKTGELIMTLGGHEDWVMSAEFSLDGRQVVTASWDGDRTARIWNLATGAEFPARNKHDDDFVMSAKYAPNGEYLVTGAWNGAVRLWNAKTNQVLRTLQDHGAGVTSVDISRDGASIVAASKDGVARIWDAKTGSLRRTIKAEEEGPLLSVAISPDGSRVATGSAKLAADGNTSGSAKIWNVETGAYLRSFKGHDGLIDSIVFSPDGSRIVTGSDDRTAKVWNVASGIPLFTLGAHKGTVSSVAFSPDNMRILTASLDNTAIVWDARNGRRLFSLTGGEFGILSAEYSPDGERIVLATQDGDVHVWDAATGRRLLSFSDLGKPMSGSFSPDDRYVVTPWGFAARVWDVGVYGPELLKAAYNMLTDDMQKEVDRERIRYWVLDKRLRQ